MGARRAQSRRLGNTVLSKRCFRCLKVKPMNEFYRHRFMADGHLGKCKPCTRSDVRANRALRAEQYKQFERNRANRPDRVAARLAYRATERGKSAVRRSNANTVSRYPRLRAAHVATGNAIRDGRLTKGPCEICGDKRSQAHHDDYSKPLAVRWLCARHHRAWHKDNGPGANRTF